MVYFHLYESENGLTRTKRMQKQSDMILSLVILSEAHIEVQNNCIKYSNNYLYVTVRRHYITDYCIPGSETMGILMKK